MKESLEEVSEGGTPHPREGNQPHKPVCPALGAWGLALMISRDFKDRETGRGF